MHPISGDQVRHVAALARLRLSEEQVEHLRGQLGAILGYVDRLREVDVEGVEPMVGPDGAVNRLARDEPAEPMDPGVLRAMAPQTHGAFVRVPKVLGEGGA